ncbi:30S ribosomal protein S4 [Candidatus Microgenomates bacterium]|jgi:small subunit ribosomal protein S4|nr:MAG: 30S ribosomal protein S4 [Candidatus Microgenomates bacterium]
MALYFSEKCRLCRNAGEKLFLKGERCFTKCPIDKKGAVAPGQHGAKRRRKVSDFGLRLKEKQKLKRIYGISEAELKKYFGQARKVREATGEAMLQILESRLDNLVYRLGFVPSRRSARQLVSHGHVRVDGKAVNIPSYRVKPEQVISMDEKALSMTLVKSMLDKKDVSLPDWLERKAAVGKLAALPGRNKIDTNINEQLVVEYYSR